MAPQPVPLSPERLASSGIDPTRGLSPNESAFREGSATIVLPKASAAFLNPVQEFNRDLSVLAITTWSERRDAEARAKWEKKAKAKAQGKTGKGKAKRAEAEGAVNGESSADGAEASQEGGGKRIKGGEYGALKKISCD